MAQEVEGCVLPASPACKGLRVLPHGVGQGLAARAAQAGGVGGCRQSALVGQAHTFPKLSCIPEPAPGRFG